MKGTSVFNGFLVCYLGDELIENLKHCDKAQFEQYAIAYPFIG